MAHQAARGDLERRRARRVPHARGRHARRSATQGIGDFAAPTPRTGRPSAERPAPSAAPPATAAATAAAASRRPRSGADAASAAAQPDGAADATPPPREHDDRRDEARR